jgi:hypothetical protein
MPTVTEHPILKHEFRSPAQMIEKQRELLGITTPFVPVVVSAAPLLGTWVNCKQDTGSLVRLVISAQGKEISMHAFGACSPTPCDWGKVDGMIYADNVCATPAVGFTAQYKFDFVETTMVGHIFDGALFVEVFDHFTDKSGRADLYSLNIMSK